MGIGWRACGATGASVASRRRRWNSAPRTAILSNSFVGAREREQASYGFGDLCDLIVYSHEEGMRKPDQRIYALVCQRLGVAPAETIFLDDVEENVVAARAVGMHAIHFRDNAQAIAAIDAWADMA